MKMLTVVKNIIFVSLMSVFIVACGGGGGGSGGSSSSISSRTGIFVDDVVEGIYYKSKSTSGYTNAQGKFPFNNETVEFFVGDIKIGEITALPSDSYVFIQDILGLSRENVTNEKLINIATFLQSLDSDTTTDEIEIKKEDFDKFTKINKDIDAVDIDTVLREKGFTKKSKAEVQLHLSSSFSKYNNIIFDQNEKDFLYNQFHTNYFWADKVETKSYSQYSNPNDMIDAFKYSNIDKWSYAETFEEYSNGSEQRESGFGCYFMGTSRINFIEIGSPCEEAGLKRGDELVKINNVDVTNENYKKARENNGVQVTFTVNRNGESLDINITPSIYTYKASKRYVFTSESDKKVGYFIYNGFTSKSSEEIEEAFTHFKENEIEELVIDLRYNGGGSLTIASILLDKLGGYNNEDNQQFYLKDGNGNVVSDREYTFTEDENSLDLSRVFFLTSEYTASASEAVINALKPYMDVITIGNTTGGKPVGMSAKTNSAKYIYWLINFGIYNSDDVGEYFNGINPSCSLDDDIFEQRGDENENLLKGALYYIDNNICIKDSIIQNADENHCYECSHTISSYPIIQYERYLMFINDFNKKIYRYDLSEKKFVDVLHLSKDSIDGIHLFDDILYFIHRDKEYISKIDLSKDHLQQDKFIDISMLDHITNVQMSKINNLIILNTAIRGRYVFDLNGNLLNYESNYDGYRHYKMDFDKKRAKIIFAEDRNLYLARINPINGELLDKEVFIKDSNLFSWDLKISSDYENILFGEKIFNITSKEIKKDFDREHIEVFHWDSSYLFHALSYFGGRDHLTILDSNFNQSDFLDFDNRNVIVKKVVEYDGNYTIVLYNYDTSQIEFQDYIPK